MVKVIVVNVYSDTLIRGVMLLLLSEFFLTFTRVQAKLSPSVCLCEACGQRQVRGVENIFSSKRGLLLAKSLGCYFIFPLVF